MNVMAKTYKVIDIVEGIVKMKVEKGASNKTILDFLVKDLGYSQSAAYDLMQQARGKIQEIWNQNLEAHLEEAKGQLEDLYEGAIKDKNKKLALEIRKEMNRLMGLYNDKVTVQGSINTITTIKLVEFKKDEGIND
jgi:hypothetical protein